MNIYTKIATYALVAVVGLPTVAMGSSFTASLIQGKTPAEAVQIIAEQVDMLTGRVATLEKNQEQTNRELDALRAENDSLQVKADAALSASAEMKAGSAAKAQCADLSAQLSAKEAAVKKTYLAEMVPIQNDLRDLKNQKASVSAGTSISAEALAQMSPAERDAARASQSASAESIVEVRAEIDAKEAQIDAIQERMGAALESSTEVQSLQAELNALSCA